MVTRVPPDTGPNDGHALSTETSLTDNSIDFSDDMCRRVYSLRPQNSVNFYEILS